MIQTPKPTAEAAMLSHEKLKVYDFTIEFYALTSLVVDSLPRGHGSVKDQLKRAATSIPLNIAEGAGKITPRDQRSTGVTLEFSSLFVTPATPIGYRRIVNVFSSWFLVLEPCRKATLAGLVITKNQEPRTAAIRLSRLTS